MPICCVALADLHFGKNTVKNVGMRDQETVTLGGNAGVDLNSGSWRRVGLV